MTLLIRLPSLPRLPRKKKLERNLLKKTDNPKKQTKKTTSNYLKNMEQLFKIGNATQFTAFLQTTEKNNLKHPEAQRKTS